MIHTYYIQQILKKRNQNMENRFSKNLHVAILINLYHHICVIKWGTVSTCGEFHRVKITLISVIIKVKKFIK